MQLRESMMYRRNILLASTGFLLGLIFDPKDEGDMFF
jgi:hypothetical protein